MPVYDADFDDWANEPPVPLRLGRLTRIAEDAQPTAPGGGRELTARVLSPSTTRHVFQNHHHRA